MKFPKIDLSSLPDLDTIAGIFGSISDSGGPTVDDRVVVMMTYIYEMAPPEALL